MHDAVTMMSHTRPSRFQITTLGDEANYTPSEMFKSWEWHGDDATIHDTHAKAILDGQSYSRWPQH